MVKGPLKLFSPREEIFLQEALWRVRVSKFILKLLSFVVDEEKLRTSIVRTSIEISYGKTNF